MNLLLLGQASNDLASLLQTAGYQVIEVKDVVSCCRHLKAGLPAPKSQVSAAPPAPPAAAEDGAAMGITIFNPAARGPRADTDAEAQPDRLLDYILSLARQLNPGWHLSMRYRRLESPNGASMALTSLEFSFIKMFAMVDTGEAISRKQIVQTFGEDYLSYDQNRIDTMVRRLRRKAESDLGMKLPLNTERVRGYSFGDLLIIDP
jgi:hypothetical protein